MKRSPLLVLTILFLCCLVMPTRAQNCNPAGAQTVNAGSFVTTATTIKVYNSIENGPNSAAARNAVDLQDDAWRAGAVTDNVANDFITWSDTTTPQTLSATLPRTFNIAGVNIDYDFRDFPTNYRTATQPCTGSAISPNTLRRTFLSKRVDMQTSPTTGTTNEAPRPASLYNTTNQPLIYDEADFASGGDADQGARDSTINGTVFTFSTEVSGFGAWFGDTESRTVGGGAPMTVRLLNAAGNRIGNDILIQPRADQSGCGDDNTGCGNRVTRWIGFTDTALTPQVKQMVVVIGYQGGSGSANTQRFSFIGPTLPVFFLAAPATVGGRVLTANGSGIKNARVTLRNLNGMGEQAATTNQFGYYEFSDVPVGESYIVTVSAKTATFSPSSQIITLQDNLSDLNFTADESRFGNLLPEIKIDKWTPKNNNRQTQTTEKDFERVYKSLQNVNTDF